MLMEICIRANPVGDQRFPDCSYKFQGMDVALRNLVVGPGKPMKPMVIRTECKYLQKTREEGLLVELLLTSLSD